MKKLTCEMCGSADIVKQEGVFICQYCGCKYSVEEAKKMMNEIEGTVEVTGTVKVDSTDEIENLLIRAKQFENENQTQRALEYYNKILDINAYHPIARDKIIELSAFYIGNMKVSKASIEKIDVMMSNNQKLDAIKYVREISGLGLADAKAWVENYKFVDLNHPQTIGTLLSETSASNSNSNNTIKPSGSCYIATCVYGSYDCPQVWTLRRYRDNTLGVTWYGRVFIRVYYAISPALVKCFGNTIWFKKMWKGTLDKMVKKLKENGVENTPYEDKIW